MSSLPQLVSESFRDARKEIVPRLSPFSSFPAHQRPTVLPNPFRLVHRRKQLWADRHLARRERSELGFLEGETSEEEMDEGLLDGGGCPAREGEMPSARLDRKRGESVPLLP